MQDTGEKGKWHNRSGGGGTILEGRLCLGGKKDKNITCAAHVMGPITCAAHVMGQCRKLESKHPIQASGHCG